MGAKKKEPEPEPDVRWYAARGASADTRQLKFAGVPAKDLQKVVDAVQKLFPNMKPY